MQQHECAWCSNLVIGCNTRPRAKLTTQGGFLRDWNSHPTFRWTASEKEIHPLVHKYSKLLVVQTSCTISNQDLESPGVFLCAQPDATGLWYRIGLTLLSDSPKCLQPEHSDRRRSRNISSSLRFSILNRLNMLPKRLGPIMTE